MKALVLSILWGTSMAQQDQLWNEFQTWQIKHGKTYASNGESANRFVVWKSNREFVNAHNAETSQGRHSFSVSLNAFGDMTNEEYRRELLGFRSKQDDSSDKIIELTQKNAPASWDWRPKGVVNDIQDQSACGSCWAFSAVAAMEFAANYKFNGSVPSQCQGNICGPNKTPCCKFSEQELVDCANGGKDTCKVGGEMSDGVSEIVNQMKGVFETEKQYPYTSGWNGTSPGVCKAKSGGVQTSISGFQTIPFGDENALKNAAAQAVVSIGIDASQQSFQFYSGGVYDESNCSNAKKDLDHGVAIVGYGSGFPPQPPSACHGLNNHTSCVNAHCWWCTDGKISWCNARNVMDKCSSNLSLDPQGDYWIVRNSWGDWHWGVSGYIYMSRNKKNQCGVASDALIVKSSGEYVVV
jgi:cathepsin L